MTQDKRAELGPGPQALQEKYCRACGELRPVRVHFDDDGTKRYSCAKCQAPLGEEAADSFDKPNSGFPHS